MSVLSKILIMAATPSPLSAPKVVPFALPNLHLHTFRFLVYQNRNLHYYFSDKPCQVRL